MNEKMRIEISWSTLWQLLVFLVLIILFFSARAVWGILFAAVVISLGLDPVVSFLERRGVHRLLGTIVVFAVAIGILSAAIFFLVPTLIKEAGVFINEFSGIISRIFGIRIPSSAIQGLSENLDRILDTITTLGGSITGTISGVIHNIVYVLATFVITFYFSVERNGPERLMRALLPDPYEKPVLAIFSRFEEKIRRWLFTQMGLGLIVGTVVALGMWILGVPYALTLGFVAAIFELVPVVGPVLSGVSAFLIGVSQSPLTGLYVAIFFVIVQQLENNLLVPFVVSKSIRVHPVMVLIALLAGAEIAGVGGVILAVPIALLVQETLSYFAAQKTARRGLV